MNTTQSTPVKPINFIHQFVDREKPRTGINLLCIDINKDGIEDIVCGAWWYKAPYWKRYEIPGVLQVFDSYDLDNDGQQELICLKSRNDPKATNWYGNLGCEMVWIKPVNPEKGEWEEYPISTGNGDWPHGSIIAPVLPGNKPAFITAYHSSYVRPQDYPEIFEIPSDPKTLPWPRRTFAEVSYWENYLSADLFKDGNLHIVGAPFWFENNNNGSFTPHKLIENYKPAGTALADLNNNGFLDIIAGEEPLSAKNSLDSRLVWFENPGNPKENWKVHEIDTINYVHSVTAGDFDNDGQVEIIAGEHNPGHVPGMECGLYLYKKIDSSGEKWSKTLIDNRFEHHVGTKQIRLCNGKTGIVSHGWVDSKHINIWEIS